MKRCKTHNKRFCCECSYGKYSYKEYVPKPEVDVFSFISGKKQQYHIKEALSHGPNHIK